MVKLLKSAKNAAFRSYRAGNLSTKVRNLYNFLDNADITRGIAELKDSKILVLAPHPDDESIGCGGTLKRLTSSGAVVDVAIMTRGERGIDGPAEVRERYADRRAQLTSAAAKVLGVRNLEFFGGFDGQLHLQPKLYLELLARLVINEYDCVFCPWPFDSHSDHQATFRILTRALRDLPRNIEVWLYEVWNPLIANRAVSIDDTIEDKMKAVRIHMQEDFFTDYAAKSRALAEYRSLLDPDARYVEAFLTGDKSFILGLLPSW